MANENQGKDTKSGDAAGAKTTADTKTDNKTTATSETPTPAGGRAMVPRNQLGRDLPTRSEASRESRNARTIRVELTLKVNEQDEQEMLDHLRSFGELRQLPENRGEVRTRKTHDAYGNPYDKGAAPAAPEPVDDEPRRKPSHDAYGNSYDGAGKKTATHDAYGNPYEK